MDRQEAALAMETVPKGKLLFAMRGIEGLINVQRDRRWECPARC